MFHNMHIHPDNKIHSFSLFPKPALPELTLDEGEIVEKLSKKDDFYYLKEIAAAEGMMLRKRSMYVVYDGEKRVFLSIDSHNNLARCEY